MAREPLPASARSITLDGVKFHCYKKVLPNPRGSGSSPRGYCRRYRGEAFEPRRRRAAQQR